MPAEWVVVGRVGRPHGLAGALRVEATGPTLPLLPAGATLRARGPGDAPPRHVALADRSGTAPRLLVRFAGVDAREAAARLTGAVLEVPAEALPPLADMADTVYVRDLIGCEVRVGDRPLGHVVEVHAGPANDVLEVAGPTGAVLVPFTADALPHVDVGGRLLVVREGLLPD